MSAPRRSRRGHHDRRRRGQSLVELALILPVLVLVFCGVWTVADLTNDKETVDHAVRAGARVAAEIGNNGYVVGGARQGCQTVSNTDPCIVDGQIVQSVVAILSSQVSHATITEIDVYQPSACAAGTTWGAGCPPNDGSYQSGNRIDRYDAGGTLIGGTTPTYTLDLRTQVHPDEASVGVRVLFNYTSPSLRMFTMSESAYSVVRLAPVFV